MCVIFHKGPIVLNSAVKTPARLHLNLEFRVTESGQRDKGIPIVFVVYHITSLYMSLYYSLSYWLYLFSSNGD